MTLAALQHLIRAADALAENRSFLVLGSASLLLASTGLLDAAELASRISCFDIPVELTPRLFSNYKHCINHLPLKP
jgi:hypothetical protein